jgi:hypothetical protein
MNDERPGADRLRTIPGADDAALGLTGVPEGAAPAAEVDGSEHLVPGTGFDDHPLTEAKPWQTTLAAQSSQAGVANDPPDAQPPLYPNEAVSRAEDESDPH